MSHQATQALRESVPAANLDPMPIPDDWVVDGDPRASGVVLWKSADGRLANGIWECTPGAFSWTHADETATIVSGRATVTPEGAGPIELGPGDVVFFPEGTRTRWQVHETVRKSFHLHAADGLPF